MEELQELLHNIYEEIKEINMKVDINSVPNSEDLFESIATKYSVAPFTIPKLMKMLVESHMIFSFTLVEADRKAKVRRMDGFVIAKIDTLKKMLKYFEEELELAYSIEFTRKATPEKIIKEITSDVMKHNNTRVGMLTAIVNNLVHFITLVEKNIMNYSDLKKKTLLGDLLEKSEPLSFFTVSHVETAPETNVKEVAQEKRDNDKDRKSVDPKMYSEFKKNVDKLSMEKVLKVYGIEFYTRVCFRDYQFSLIKKLVDDDLIKSQEELNTIKNLLRKERANSDKDLNLQKFAKDINDLEKSLNIKLRQE